MTTVKKDKIIISFTTSDSDSLLQVYIEPKRWKLYRSLSYNIFHYKYFLLWIFCQAEQKQGKPRENMDKLSLNSADVQKDRKKRQQICILELQAKKLTVTDIRPY